MLRDAKAHYARIETELAVAKEVVKWKTRFLKRKLNEEMARRFVGGGDGT